FAAVPLTCPTHPKVVGLGLVPREKPGSSSRFCCQRSPKLEEVRMIGTRRLFVGVLFLSISLYLTLPASAQGVGAIGGSVLDASGAVLPGAAVTLISPQGT